MLAKTRRSGVSSRSLTRPPKHRHSQKTTIFQSTSELELREDTTVWAKNILCPKVDQVGQKLAASALGSKNLQKLEEVPVPPSPPKMLKNEHFGVGPPAGVGRCASRCATRPVGTGDVIGRRWPRCSTWTIGVRSLLRFGPFAPGTPSSSRGPHVRSVAPMYAAIPLFPLFWTGETGNFGGATEGKCMFS